MTSVNIQAEPSASSQSRIGGARERTADSAVSRSEGSGLYDDESNLVFRLPRYYQDSPQVSELERVLGAAAKQLMEAKEDTLAQLFVETATWGLGLWEGWCGLPSDPTVPYSQRRQRILAKLRGQGPTTAEMIAGVVASFGFSQEQISVVEHPEEYTFEVVISDLAEAPENMAAPTQAVNEIKPAHLDWWFIYQLSQLLILARIGAGLWTIREVTLPAAEV